MLASRSNRCNLSFCSISRTCTSSTFHFIFSIFMCHHYFRINKKLTIIYYVNLTKFNSSSRKLSIFQCYNYMALSWRYDFGLLWKIITSHDLISFTRSLLITLQHPRPLLWDENFITTQFINYSSFHFSRPSSTRSLHT